MKIVIREPIWNGEKVGIKTSTITDDVLLEVEITYKDKHGQRTFPYLYTMPGDKAKWYPTRRGSGRVPDLTIIPISSFDTREL